jgi:serine kinase of HPr protein (carbohydrate metabolism regulator)
MNLRLSSETIHASTVALNGRAVLITGISGSGKSDLALQLIDRGFTLVSDDQTIVQKRGQRLHASAPATIRGKLEIRGLGIVPMPLVEDVPIALVVELASVIQRFPSDARERMICGLPVPLVSIDAQTASAASKVSLALDHFGLK